MRFEVLLDEPFIAPWQCRCVEQLGAVATLTAIRTARSVSGAPRSSAGARRVGAADLLGRSIDAGTHFAPVACSAEPRPGDGSEPHDFAIAFGRFTPEAATGRWPHFGVWRFQHDVAGNALPFFEETESGADVTYAALVAIVGSGSPVLLEQGWFRTEKLSYRRQLEHLLTRISEWPARVCGRLAQNPSGFPAAVAPNPAPAPGRPRVLRYRTRVLARRARLAFERAFRHQQWNVGLLNARPDELVRPGGYDDRRIEWFPLSTRDRFLADPFGVEREGALHVFCEEYPYRVGRGHIARLAWPGSELRHERALELAVHMSYPFLIDEGERTYCVPETSQANEVALYECDDFPSRWRKVAVLLPDFAGVDSTIFRHADRWWLTCTKRAHDEDAALWIWHAPTLTGPWTPHARNPVKTDVRGARPGGVPFRHEGVLYRPAQDCSKHYGWRIVIQRVTALTPFEFMEEPASVLEPSPHSPFPLGRHTLTVVGNSILIDGHRRVFAWPAFRAFTSIVARDLLARVGRRRAAAVGSG